jgi:hypothetical protein
MRPFSPENVMTIDSAALVAGLRTEPAPVSFAKLKKAHVNKKAGALEAHLRAAIEAALGSGVIFAWPKNSFWHIDPEARLQSEILSRCATKASKKSEIKVAGRSGKDVSRSIERLAAEKKLLPYPALAGTSVLLVSADSPQAYWAYVQTFVADKLKKAGIEEVGLEDKIWDILPQLEPEKNVPVSTARVRGALGLAEADKKRFDEAVLKMREQRRVYLSQHDHPQGLSSSERDGLVDGRDGRYYVAITRRDS